MNGDMRPKTPLHARQSGGSRCYDHVRLSSRQVELSIRNLRIGRRAQTCWGRVLVTSASRCDCYAGVVGGLRAGFAAVYSS